MHFILTFTLNNRSCIIHAVRYTLTDFTFTLL